MTNLLPLAIFTFEVAPIPAKAPGRKGDLRWLPLAKLRIDDSYQRPIDASGKKNIRRIIENFAWHKFAPIVVSPRKGGIYAVVDGQHRAVACALHGGILEVPCLVLSCTPEEEASAFATINGLVTRMHPQYLFRARIAAGDTAAVAANEAAQAAGARIMPYPAAASQLKVGETLAGRTIELELARVGRSVVVAALELVTRTGAGNAGLLKASVIEGFCDVYAANHKWLAAQDEARRIVHRKTVKAIIADGMRRQADNPGSLRNHVAAVLSETLSASLGDGGITAIKTGAMVAREIARKSVASTAKKKPVTRPAPIVAHDPKVKLRPMPKVATAASVSGDERAMIEAHLKSHGARKFESGATGNHQNLINWLERQGVEIKFLGTGHGNARRPYLIAGRKRTEQQFFDFVNAKRKELKLQPLTLTRADGGARTGGQA